MLFDTVAEPSCKTLLFNLGGYKLCDAGTQSGEWERMLNIHTIDHRSCGGTQEAIKRTLDLVNISQGFIIIQLVLKPIHARASCKGSEKSYIVQILKLFRDLATITITNQYTFLISRTTLTFEGKDYWLWNDAIAKDLVAYCGRSECTVSQVEDQLSRPIRFLLKIWKKETVFTFGELTFVTFGGEGGERVGGVS